MANYNNYNKFDKVYIMNQLLITCMIFSLYTHHAYAGMIIPTTNSNQAVLISSHSNGKPSYQEFSPNPGKFFSPQAPGYNQPDDDPKFHAVKVVAFKAEDLSTGTLTHTDLDEDKIGYFWNIHDTDPSLIYQREH
jgi:hypothetical protein